MRLKAPEVEHVFRKCLICGMTFRIWRSRLGYRAGDFRTAGCYSLGRKVFSKLLKDGRFGAGPVHEFEFPYALQEKSNLSPL
jgi:hypothetical protein